MQLLGGFRGRREKGEGRYCDKKNSSKHLLGRCCQWAPVQWGWKIRYLWVRGRDLRRKTLKKQRQPASIKTKDENNMRHQTDKPSLLKTTPQKDAS